MMRPPRLFYGQPVWASLLVLLSYLVLGPFMQDEGPQIERPPPATKDRCVVAVSLVALTLICFAFFSYLEWSAAAIVLATTIMLPILTLLVVGKPAVRVLVNAYQRRAPAQVRQLCAQTPSCSDYFLLSVSKYGVLKGGYRGWRRLKRCDGTLGEDWP